MIDSIEEIWDGRLEFLPLEQNVYRYTQKACLFIIETSSIHQFIYVGETLIQGN
jgi:hypothetical protein